MINATYTKTTDIGQEPDRKAISVIDIDGQEISVSWWPSLVEQWGKDGVKSYLEAEALFQISNFVAAKVKLTPFATGSDKRQHNVDGVVSGEDTRNWAQRWIDEHAGPTQVSSVVDPLL